MGVALPNGGARPMRGFGFSRSVYESSRRPGIGARHHGELPGRRTVPPEERLRGHPEVLQNVGPDTESSQYMSSRGADTDRRRAPAEYSRQPYFVWKVFLLLLAGIVAVTAGLTRLTTLETSNILAAVNIVVNVLLTGALIILYRDLSTIQARQVQAMKASDTPLVGIIGWEMTAEAFEQDSAGSSERLALTLSNKGNSIARDLRVSFAVSYETAGPAPRIRSKEVPVRRTEGRSWWHSDMGASLPEGTAEVDFYTTPSFVHVRPDTEDDEEIRFDKVAELLSAAGIERARVALSLRYRNAAGEESEIEFAVYEFDPHARPERLSDAQKIRNER